MPNITTNSEDAAWYDEMMDPNVGVVDGMSNAGFFGAIIGGLVLICAIIGLIYHCKRKKELEEMVKEQEEEKARANNKVAPSQDIYEEMESEIKKHEDQKKKLSKYLSFLLNKDAHGLKAVNDKRLAAQRARKTNGWF
ncbi:hypothetical protein ACF0H5_011447 [Mactra antiquata]